MSFNDDRKPDEEETEDATLVDAGEFGSTPEYLFVLLPRQGDEPEDWEDATEDEAETGLMIYPVCQTEGRIQ